MATFDEIYEEHFDFVWRTARRLGVPASAAADAAQDVFLVLHRRLPDFDGRSSMKKWILGIVTRVASDHRRRYRRKDAPCVPQPDDSGAFAALESTYPAPSEDAEQAETMRVLERLLAKLDESKREVLVLAQLEEMTVPEIADVLGENRNTIYARLRTARAEFAAAYARYAASVEGGGERSVISGGRSS